MKWYSCELDRYKAEIFKDFLRSNDVKFESSQCYSGVMVSVFCTAEMMRKCNAFIDAYFMG